MVDEYSYFKVKYPRYFNAFEKRFEKFWSEWNLIVTKGGRLKQWKQYIFMELAKQLLLNINNKKNNLGLVIRYEKKDRTLTKIEKAVLEYFVEEILLVPHTMMNGFERTQKVSKLRDKMTEKKLDEIEIQYKELEIKYNEWNTKYSKYDKRMYHEAKKLQEMAEANKQKLINVQAVIKAYANLGLKPEEELVDQYGKITNAAVRTARAFSAYKNKYK